MIKIKITFAGTIYIKNLISGDFVEVENNTTISQFLQKCGFNKMQSKLVIPTVNEEEKKLDYILKDKDNLHIYMPVGGG